MQPFIPKPRKTPEARVQEKLVNRLRMERWHVEETHGNEYQTGFPDIFACHRSLGSRWIEVKLESGSRLEQSQFDTFQEFTKRKVGVWILTDSDDWEFNKLFQPANWYHYLSIMKHRGRIGKTERSKPNRPQKDGPERQIQNKIKEELTIAGWYVKDTFGSIYQHGLPDLYACHALYGYRWIEVKNPEGFRFTGAQASTFPLMAANGAGVWILQSHEEIPLLFKAYNYWHYLQ